MFTVLRTRGTGGAARLCVLALASRPTRCAAGRSAARRAARLRIAENAARVAESGAEAQDGNKQSVLDAVADAERANFEVGEDSGMTHPLDKVDGLHAFYKLVKADGPWDHEPQIRNMVGIQRGDGLYFQEPGTGRQVYYDIYSNLHYGFVGRAAGIPESTLMGAANLHLPMTGTNDIGDDIVMRAGISMFDRFGPNMAAAQFHSGIAQVIDRLEAAQRAGEAITQMKYGYK